MHLSRSDKTVDMIVKAAFPDYTGNKIQSEVVDTVSVYNTSWDEGNKRDYVIVQLSTMRAITISDCPYGMIDNRTIKVEPGYIICVRVYSGVNTYVYLYCSANDITPSLEHKEELSKNEMIVLIATRSYKSSYAGISNYRFHQASGRITLENWESTKKSLIDNGYLNKAGAITIKGKNAVGFKSLYDLD